LPELFFEKLKIKMSEPRNMLICLIWLPLWCSTCSHGDSLCLYTYQRPLFGIVGSQKFSLWLLHNLLSRQFPHHN